MPQLQALRAQLREAEALGAVEVVQVREEAPSGEPSMQALQAIVARDPQVASLARQLVEIALVNRSFVPMLRKATATEIAATGLWKRPRRR